MFAFVKNLFSSLSFKAAVYSIAINVSLLGGLAYDIHHTLTMEKVKAVPYKEEASVNKPRVVEAKTEAIVETKTVVDVIDVNASIRSWNEEAWCRTYWNDGLKCWFKDRQLERPAKAKAIAEAFNKVWGDAPIHVQKLALSICLKETGCGFSEQRSYRKRGGKITNKGGTRTWKATKFMSKREACGLTQVDTRDNIGKVKCSVLNKSYENAFKWQKIWLEEYWNDGHKTKPSKIDLYGSEWLEPYQIDGDNTSYLIWRYNGGGKIAWEYGRITMNIYYNHIVTKKVEIKQ